MQTMIHIPEELLEQAERGNVLLFIGERVVRDASGQVVLDQLTAQLAARGGLVDTGDITFPEAAQIYEDTAGRQALIQFLRDQFEALGDEPQPVHRLIAGLADCNLMVTTCLDRRLERAFKEADRPLDVITGTVDIAFEDERKPRLYRLRGVLDRAESLVLTEDDYETFFEDQSSISIVLQGYLARKTILFVGYDLADPQFKRLYRKVTAPLDDYARRAYAFSTELDTKVARWCERHGISVIAVDGAILLEALAGQLATRIHPKALTAAHIEQALQPPPPEHPYKLLDYYESDDAAIFFGRDEEIQALSSLIHGHRLVLVYGASGVGKTSLLLAGAVTSLERADPPYQAIYIRALGDPAQIIRDTIHRELSDVSLPINGTLVNFLASATRVTGRKLVIVLDQFEEFFIRLSPQFREAFIADLGAIYDARDVPVKIVISLREDWLAAVSQIEQRIPEVFRTKLWLLPLTREQARQAIVRPVERRDVRYEPALVERLLEDLLGTTGVDVMPPQLQLVCSALYAKLGPNERTITLATYEQLGGARGVLRRYLEDELNRLGHDERTLARGALEELVTSQSTKAVKSAEEVALQLEVAVAKLAPVLEKLVRARLLRLIERQDGEMAFELAHEYLIREIGLGEGAKERKEVEELIGQEVENWQRFQTLLAADKLARIGEVRELLRLSPEAQELLLRSALQVGDEIEYWLNRVSDAERRVAVLVEITKSKLALVRRRAAEVLATQDVPEAVEPLLALTLHDPDRMVRLAARVSLTAFAGQRPMIIARLQPELTNENRRVRRAALRTLSTLPLRELPRGLRTRALATRLNLGFNWLVEQSVATPIRRTVATSGLLLLALIGLAYIFSLNSYYVDSQPSSVPGQNTLVIRHGNPFLNLPGLGGVEADTGIQESMISNDHWNEVHNAEMWWFWVRNDARGYQQWGQALSEALRPEGRAPMLWYLVQRNDAFDVLLKSTDNQELPTQMWRIRALAQVLSVNPSLATSEVTETLFPLITDPASDLRLTALSTFRQIMIAKASVATPDIVDRLAPLLEEHDSRLRASVAAVLVQAGSANIALATPKMAEKLTILIREQNNDEPFDGAIFLSELLDGDSALTPQMAQALINLLGDQDRHVRSNTIAALGYLTSNNPTLATPQLAERLTALLKDRDSDVRASAISAMEYIAFANPTLATPQLAERLTALLKDRDSDVRANAITALGYTAAANPNLATPQLTETLATLLRDSDSNISTQAAVALLQLEHDHINLLIPQIAEALAIQMKKQSSAGSGNLRYMLSPVLNPNNAPPPVVMETIIQLLNNNDSQVRIDAAVALGGIASDMSQPTSEIAKTLAKLLMDQDRHVRANAIAALGSMKTAPPELATVQVTDTLISTLTDQDKSVRADAIKALGNIGTANSQLAPQISERMIIALADPDSTMRSNAARALGSIGASNSKPVTPQLIDKLINELKDTNNSVRSSTVIALGQIVSNIPSLAIPDLIKRLTAMLADQDSTVRLEATNALTRIYAEQTLKMGVNEDRYYAILKDPLRALERPSAARALFLISLSSHYRGQAIRDQLQSMSFASSSDPLVRIWTNKTLALLDLVDMVHTTAVGARWNEVQKKLETFSKFSRTQPGSYLTYLTSSGSSSSVSFFGEDFTWAADQAKTWLEQRATREKE